MGHNHGTCGTRLGCHQMAGSWCNCCVVVETHKADLLHIPCPYNVLGELSCYLVRWSQLLIFAAICF